VSSRTTLSSACGICAVFRLNRSNCNTLLATTQHSLGKIACSRPRVEPLFHPGPPAAEESTSLGRQRAFSFELPHCPRLARIEPDHLPYSRNVASWSLPGPPEHVTLILRRDRKTSETWKNPNFEYTPRKLLVFSNLYIRKLSQLLIFRLAFLPLLYQYLSLSFSAPSRPTSYHLSMNSLSSCSNDRPAVSGMKNHAHARPTAVIGTKNQKVPAGPSPSLAMGK
jgi:hypothetical protein